MIEHELDLHGEAIPFLRGQILKARENEVQFCHRREYSAARREAEGAAPRSTKTQRHTPRTLEPSARSAADRRSDSRALFPPRSAAARANPPRPRSALGRPRASPGKSPRSPGARGARHRFANAPDMG